MSVKDFLTPENPLGPFRHERILKRVEEEPANILIYPASSFDGILRSGRPIVIGRRGSGKTAVVSAMIARSGREHHNDARGGVPNIDGDIYVLINSWDHLDDLVEKVGTDAVFAFGPTYEWSSALPETLSRLWSRRIWMVIFQQIYRDSISNPFLAAHLAPVIRYIRGQDVLSPGREITDQALDDVFQRTKNSVLSFLKERKRKCYLVIDSLEYYPVTSPRFQKLIAGLLKCVNDFGDDNPGISVLCCIPEEVEPYIAPRSSNRLKDLSARSSVSRLRWSPYDLLRIVAERYRQFLRLYTHDDRDFINHIMALDFSSRTNLRQFYDLIMPSEIINRLGQKERAIPYVVRHSQLLPREFLMIFDSAIKLSHQETGTWRHLSEAAIVAAVQNQEPELADQILSPYESIYPDLIDICKRAIPELPPICELSDLDRVGGRLRRLVRHETDDPWEVLFQIGVIGFIDEDEGRAGSTDYEYGAFHFNSLGPITFATGRKYCVHPIFSGTWRLKRGDNLRSIYPAKIAVDPWD